MPPATASIFDVMLLGARAAGSNFDFTRFNFQVPIDGLNRYAGGYENSVLVVSAPLWG